MIGQRTALRLFGCEVYDPYGHRLGIVGQLFIDDRTDHPAWVTVQSGLFGTNERFVPLDGAAYDGDTLTVAVSKEAVRAAPRVCLEQCGDLLLEQERELYLHYGMEHGLTPASARSGEPATRAEEATPEYVEAVRLRLRSWATAS